MANFLIKYSDQYPVYDFYETIEIEGDSLIDYEYKISETDALLGHAYDDDKTIRKIQVIVYRIYEVETIVGKNIDLYKLAASNHVDVTTEDGETFTAVETTVVYDQIDGNRDSKATVTFKRQMYISQPLSSDHASNLHGDVPVNRLTYTVTNAPFIFVGNIQFDGGTNKFYFTVDLTDLYDLIDVGDVFYSHVMDTTFDNETHFIAECTTKTATEITFVFDVTDTTASWNNVEILLDHEPDISTSVSVVDKDIEISMYTFIDPVISNVLTPQEGTETEIGLEENQGFNSKNRSRVLFWLKDDELYKAEYLNYAKKGDVLFVSSGTTIYPIQIKDIIKEVPKESLLEMKEFEVILLNKNKEVNLNR